MIYFVVLINAVVLSHPYHINYFFRKIGGCVFPPYIIWHLSFLCESFYPNEMYECLPICEIYA